MIDSERDKVTEDRELFLMTYNQESIHKERTLEVLKTGLTKKHEMSPQVVSMLRFTALTDEFQEYLRFQRNEIDGEFLTFEDIVSMVERNIIQCVNISQLEAFLKSWNGEPLTNAEAEQALVRDDEISAEHIFGFIPLTVKSKARGNDFEPRYLMIGVNHEVLSPAEPTSTRMWLNTLYKEYDFTRLAVAEVFCGTGPAALIASLHGARVVDSFDLMEKAVAVAKGNYAAYNIPGDVYQSDVFDAAIKANKTYDIILANPPFNPKLTGTTEVEKLKEAVQDKGYQALEKFLRQLPSVLNEDGMAVVVYESLASAFSAFDTNSKQDAIQDIVSSLNNDDGFPYEIKISLRLRLRRFRGKNQPKTPFVIYEITTQKKETTDLVASEPKQ